MKHGDGSVVIWAAISWHSAGSVISLNGRITASDYVDTLGNQVHPVVQMLPKNAVFFPNDISPNTQPEVFRPGISNMKMHFSTFPGHHSHQI